MKLKIFPLLFSLFFILNTFSVNAQVPNRYIADGYTSEGIYYMVYEEETNNVQNRAVGDTIEVTRKFYYTAVIKPPATRTYTEQLNGITYTGTLKLTIIDYEGENTIAYYKGTLTAIN